MSTQMELPLVQRRTQCRQRPVVERLLEIIRRQGVGTGRNEYKGRVMFRPELQRPVGFYMDLCSGWECMNRFNVRSHHFPNHGGIMTTTTAPASLTPPALLSAWPEQGGIYVGTKATPDGRAWYIVAAIDHQLEDQAWGPYRVKIDGAGDYHDSRANTEAMAAGGSELAKQILALDIGGHTDWALPGQADGHLLAANAKHLMDQGDSYWLSTQYSASNAWYQHFGNGNQNINYEDAELRAVPVRTIQIA